MDAVFFIFVMHIDSLWRLLLIVIPQRQQNVRFTAVAAVRESSEPAYRRSGRPRSTSLIPQRQQNVRFTAVAESQGKFADNHVGRVYYFFIFVGCF